MTINERIRAGWNAFMNRDPPTTEYYGPSSYRRPDIYRANLGNEKSIIAPIYNKIAMDCASLDLKHVQLDKDGKYIRTIDSGLNTCLTLNANNDQTAREFIQDAIYSMFDEGVIALVPIDTSVNPFDMTTFDIKSMRTGKIVQWYPNYVMVNAYDQRDGIRKDILMPKAAVAIVQNPLYAVMNERNSVGQRLIRTLNYSDTIDEQNGSGKLDMIVQLPYSVRNEAMEARAEKRRANLEQQLTNSKYGIAYADATEKIVQLNRGVENNLYQRVEFLTNMLHGQLGITPEILNGTATPEAMQNYYSRTIEPVIGAVIAQMNWKFLTAKGRTQGQTIMIFRDPFKLVPVEKLADIADKFTRNEIMSSNEMRQKVGMIPVNDEKANELRNKNISVSEGQEFANTEETNNSTNQTQE